MSGDSVAMVFTREELASLPEAWRDDAHGAFKQLCLSQKDEFTFRRRARACTLITYFSLVVVLLALNVGAAVGWIHIAAGWVTLVQSGGVTSFISLAAGALKEWISPYSTKPSRPA